MLAVCVRACARNDNEHVTLCTATLCRHGAEWLRDTSVATARFLQSGAVACLVFKACSSTSSHCTNEEGARKARRCCLLYAWRNSVSETTVTWSCTQQKKPLRDSEMKPQLSVKYCSSSSGHSRLQS